jgi:hypothetical protein
MNHFDMTWRQINLVRRPCLSDRIQSLFLRAVLFAYRFERDIAINPQVKHGLSQTITRLEGDLHRVEIR